MNQLYLPELLKETEKYLEVSNLPVNLVEIQLWEANPKLWEILGLPEIQDI